MVLNESLAAMFDFLPTSLQSPGGHGAAAGLEIPTVGCSNCVKHKELCRLLPTRQIPSLVVLCLLSPPVYQPRNAVQTMLQTHLYTCGNW